MTLKDSNTEEKILEAAKEVFMKFGLYGSRMQDIADRAGINKALLHYYFRSKEKLFDTVFDNALERYFAQMRVLADTDLTIQERIFKYIDNIIDFFHEYPAMSMFIIKELSIDPEMFQLKVMNLKRGNGVSILTVLKEGMDAGEIPTFDRVLFMVNLHSLCAYPFIASPIFKVICTKANEEWSHLSNLRLKESVKDFVAQKLNTTRS